LTALSIPLTFIILEPLSLKPPLYHPCYWLSWVAVWLAKGLGLLPLPLLWCLGTITGRLAYYLLISRRRIAHRNIELCFPELSAGEVNRLTHRHFAALGVALFSSGVSWVASKKRLKRLIHYRNREYYDQAVAAGHHIIFLAPHFLGLELGGMCFSLECPGISMYQKIHNPVIDRQVYQGRCRYGGIMIEHKTSLKTLVRFLRQGLTFYYLPDLRPLPLAAILFSWPPIFLALSWEACVFPSNAPGSACTRKYMIQLLTGRYIKDAVDMAAS